MKRGEKFIFYQIAVLRSMQLTNYKEHRTLQFQCKCIHTDEKVRKTFQKTFFNQKINFQYCLQHVNIKKLLLVLTSHIR